MTRTERVVRLYREGSCGHRRIAGSDFRGTRSFLAGQSGDGLAGPRRGWLHRRHVHRVRQPIYYGQDVAAALEWVGGFACAKEVLDRLDPTGSEVAPKRLRETLVAHAREDGVWFDSRAWIVKARRP